MTSQEILKDTEGRMQKALEVFQRLERESTELEKKRRAAGTGRH